MPTPYAAAARCLRLCSCFRAIRHAHERQHMVAWLPLPPLHCRASSLPPLLITSVDIAAFFFITELPYDIFRYLRLLRHAPAEPISVAANHYRLFAC